MPYVPLEEGKEIEQTHEPKTIGQLNAYICRFYIRTEWMKSPGYAGIEHIRQNLINSPNACPFLLSLKRRLQHFTWDQVTNAAGAAYDEFMQRIGHKYEKKKLENKKNYDPFWDIVTDRP